MSERGIEIHNGYLEFPEGSPPALHLGTEATPLTQGEAGQIVVSAVIDALALGGAVKAGLFRVNATVSLTGEINGIHAIVAVEADVVVSSILRGAYFQTSLGAGSQVTGPGVYWEGLRVNMYADATSVIQSLSAIAVNNYVQKQPASLYSFLDLRENAAVTVDAIIHARTANDVTDVLFLSGTKTAWNATEDITGIPDGKIAVNVSGTQRYIQLYRVNP